MSMDGALIILALKFAAPVCAMVSLGACVRFVALLFLAPPDAAAERQLLLSAIIMVVFFVMAVWFHAAGHVS